MPFACGQNNGITINEVYILGSLSINFINHKNVGLLQQDIEFLGLNSLQKILKSFFFNLKDEGKINTNYHFHLVKREKQILEI